MRRPNVIIAAVALASLVVSACSWQRGPAARAATSDIELRAATGPRFDQPDEAQSYYQARRMPSDPNIDPRRAYAAARQRLDAMPAYSLRLDREVPRYRTPKGIGVASASAIGGSLATWEPLGPGNIGGRTRVLSIDPRDDDVMLAAGVSGGVWKTVDGGANWRPLTDDLSNIAVNSLVRRPDDPDTLYAGTGEGYFREVVRGTGLPLRGGGVFVSQDGGESWKVLESTLTADFYWVNDLLVSPRAPDRLYAATRTGVWRSADAGTTWQRVLDPAVNGGCLDLVQRTDTVNDTVFAACGTFERSTVWRNSAAELDGTWESVLSEAEMGRTSLAVAPSDQDVIYALAVSNVGGPGGTYTQSLHAVFRSTTGGGAGSWAARVRNTDPDKLSTLLLTNPVPAAYVECNFSTSNRWVPMGWYVNVIAVDPVDPDTLFAAGVDLFRSTDGGASWGVTSYWWGDPASHQSVVHADQHGIVFHPDWDGSTNQTLFVTNDGGVYRTDNALAPIGSGVTSLCDPAQSQVAWTALNHSYGVTQFYHGVPFPSGDAVIGGAQDNGSLLYTDAWGDNGWVHVLGGDGGYCAVDPSNPSTIYAESQNFNLSKSVNGGADFAPALEGITDPPATFIFITPFVLDPNDPRRLWAGGRRMWRSSSRAALWSVASTFLADGGRVSAIAVAPGDSSYVVAATDAGTIYRNDSATTSSGNRVWAGTRPRTGFVTWLAFDPVDADVVYATYGGFGGAHLWRSGDGGATWDALDEDGSLPDIPVHCVLVDPTRVGRLFLGTDLGVLVSTDSGASWNVERTGFATVVTESLSLLTTPDAKTWLYAFTHGRGAWRVKVAEGSPRAPRRASRSR